MPQQTRGKTLAKIHKTNEGAEHRKGLNGMRPVKRAMAMALAMLMLALVCLTCCGDSVQESSAGHETFSDFREIPGVTEEETAAIERLQTEVDFVVYGMSQTSEAFLEVDGNAGGFCGPFLRMAQRDIRH